MIDGADLIAWTEVPAEVVSHYLYGIYDAHAHSTKLGISNEPERRLRDMATGHHSELSLLWVIEYGPWGRGEGKKSVAEQIAYVYEQHLHARLDHRRTRPDAEWFAGKISEGEILPFLVEVDSLPVVPWIDPMVWVPSPESLTLAHLTELLLGKDSSKTTVDVYVDGDNEDEQILMIVDLQQDFHRIQLPVELPPRMARIVGHQLLAAEAAR